MRWRCAFTIDAVQANPLNTYLSTKPSFTSPQPLAAASGLTIPIQITLSEIKLSAIIILVYSNQKGVTLVFRNDPLESLKVSSTFDAIPFVREYLQKEIDGQLRTLLMDELPLIIHRLSLRLINEEYREKEDEEMRKSLQTHEVEDKIVDPLASPPQDPVDISGNVLDASQIASLSLDPGSEMHALFSQKNLLRLGALTDSHRTLALFTPSIRDAVFRAWAGPTERGEVRGGSGRATPALPRSQSYAGNMSTKYVFSDASEGPQSARPTLSSFGSAASGLGAGFSRHAKPHGRKKRHRVVNLRKKAVEGDEIESVSGDSTGTSGTGTEGTGSLLSAPSEYGARPKTPEMKEPGDADVGQTPPRLRDLTPRPPHKVVSVDNMPRVSQILPYPPDPKTEFPAEGTKRPNLRRSRTPQPSNENIGLKQLDPSPSTESSSPSTSTSFEHAWMTRIAGEILRKVQDQKAVDSGFWNRTDRHDDPPPAYGT